MPQNLKVLYHGSPFDLEELNTRREHGDPGLPEVVFASPSRTFALAYSGKKWGDRDLEQSTRGGSKGQRMILREMRPSALAETYDTPGYLYEVPAGPFKAIPERRTSKEVISTENVKPLKKHVIENVLKALQAQPVEQLSVDRYGV